MIVVNSVQAVADVIALADEIAREERIPFKAAVLRAGHQQANLLADIEVRVRYRPAKRPQHTPIRQWRYRPAKVQG